VLLQDGKSAPLKISRSCRVACRSARQCILPAAEAGKHTCGGAAEQLQRPSTRRVRGASRSCRVWSDGRASGCRRRCELWPFQTASPCSLQQLSDTVGWTCKACACERACTKSTLRVHPGIPLRHTLAPGVCHAIRRLRTCKHSAAPCICASVKAGPHHAGTQDCRRHHRHPQPRLGPRPL
jgi:hypothetical protein